MLQKSALPTAEQAGESMMRYGIAIWNYQEPGIRLPELVDTFADYGFDAVSFLPGQILRLDGAEAQELADLLKRRSLWVTVHGNFELSPPDAESIFARLRDTRLHAFTFDAAMATDSRGTAYDVPRMAALLNHIERISRGTDLRFGVEDFPLDTLALDHYREDLAPLLDCPRYGMLLDVGHLNLRRHAHPYFQKLTTEEYLERAARPLVEVHLHDNRGDRDSHGHLGFGNIDFAAVASGLRRLGFAGISTIEIAPSFHGSTPAQSRPLARESLARWRALWE